MHWFSDTKVFHFCLMPFSSRIQSSCSNRLVLSITLKFNAVAKKVHQCLYSANGLISTHNLRKRSQIKLRPLPKCFASHRPTKNVFFYSFHQLKKRIRLLVFYPFSASSYESGKRADSVTDTNACCSLFIWDI